MIVQSMWQLKHKYKDDANTIKGNCDNWVFLTSREHDLLKEISELCGRTLFTSATGDIHWNPLISISELQRLKKEHGETLIMHGRNYPFVTELPDIDEYAFKTYPPIITKEKDLPRIKYYNADSIISEIKDQKRPIPFSFEVFGKKIFYTDIQPVKKNNNLDW